MKQIRLKKLELTNFRGIQHLEIDFSEVTNIYGRNRAGKSTIANAFAWLLFGKDLEDRKDFELKPYNLHGETANNVDVEVRAEVEINGYDTELRRVFRERWEKQKGAEFPTYKGNATDTYVDGVPLNVTEYNARIDGIIDEKIFKLITNPLYFNNNLKWQDRRSVLINMAGEITNEEVLQSISNGENEEDVNNLGTILNKYSDFEAYKKKLSSDKKRLSDELKTIPSRIDQAQKSKPEELEWLDLETQIKITKDKIAEIDETLFSASKGNKALNDSIVELQNKQNDLKLEKSRIEFDITNKIKTEVAGQDSAATLLRSKIKEEETRYSQIKFSIEQNDASIEGLEARIVKERKEFHEIKNEKFVTAEDAIDIACPLCGRDHEPGFLYADNEELRKKLEVMKSEFNQYKVEKIAEIRQRGLKFSNQKSELETVNAGLKETLSELEKSIESKKAEFAELVKNRISFDQEKAMIEKAVSESPEIKKAIQGINDLQNKIENKSAEKLQDNTSELRAKKAELNSELEALTTQLAGKTQLERIDNQIKELRKQERDLSQEIANLERSEFLINDFNREKMNMVEQNINGFFEFVKFKLFEQQINGSMVETCETTYNGVKWGTLNTEGKILAGLDIINALNTFYQVSAPILLDNRESVTHIPAVSTQIINLIVSPEDKALRIEHTENQFATTF